jgi:hypothetical protein
MSSLLTKIANLIHGGETFVVALGKRELKIAAASVLGQAVTAAIKAGEAGTTAAEKMELALTAFLPTLKTYITNPDALESDVETVAKSIIEDVLAQLKTTGPLAIFEALAAVL